MDLVNSLDVSPMYYNSLANAISITNRNNFRYHYKGGQEEDDNGISLKGLQDYQSEVLNEVSKSDYNTLDKLVNPEFATGLELGENVPGTIGDVIKIGNKVVSTILPFLPESKLLNSARAREQGIDLFQDQQYIVNNDYAIGDPKRYEIDYRPPWNPDKVVHITKEDQDFYKGYQFLTAGNQTKFLRAHIAMYPEFGKRLDERQEQMTALIKLHGH
jgi:hypothetical protein